MRQSDRSRFHVNGDYFSRDTEASRPGCFEGDGSTRRDEREGEGCLRQPREALASRLLRGLPAAGALLSWVSNIVKTAVLYRQWLPWQAFADELRELVLLYIRHPPQAAGGSDKGVGREGPAAAGAASVFAACSLLLAWEAGEVRRHKKWAGLHRLWRKLLERTSTILFTLDNHFRFYALMACAHQNCVDAWGCAVSFIVPIVYPCLLQRAYLALFLTCGCLAFLASLHTGRRFPRWSSGPRYARASSAQP